MTEQTVHQYLKSISKSVQETQTTNVEHKKREIVHKISEFLFGTHKRPLIIHGSGNNGKSLLTNIIMEICKIIDQKIVHDSCMLLEGNENYNIEPWQFSNPPENYKYIVTTNLININSSKSLKIFQGAMIAKKYLTLELPNIFRYNDNKDIVDLVYNNDLFNKSFCKILYRHFLKKGSLIFLCINYIKWNSQLFSKEHINKNVIKDIKKLFELMPNQYKNRDL